jgi:hypothetical protein
MSYRFYGFVSSRFSFKASIGAALFWSLSKNTNTSQPCAFQDRIRFAQAANASAE